MRSTGKNVSVHPTQLATLQVDYKRAFVLMVREWFLMWYDLVLGVYSMVSNTYPESMRAKWAVGKTRLVETAEERNELCEIHVTKSKLCQAQLLELDPKRQPEEFHKATRRLELQLRLNQLIIDIYESADKNAQDSLDNPKQT